MFIPKSFVAILFVAIAHAATAVGKFTRFLSFHGRQSQLTPGPDEGSKHSSDVGISLRDGPLKTCFEECDREYEEIQRINCKIYCLADQIDQAQG